jgi:multiple sugar transport system substrate-binding protein
VARLSTWEDAQVKAAQKMPQDWVDAFVQGNKIGAPGLPEIAAVTEYRDTVGALFQGAIEGGNAKDIIKKANEAFQAILDKEK